MNLIYDMFGLVLADPENFVLRTLSICKYKANVNV